MFIDTHCHLNMMVKKKFDALLQPDEIQAAESIIKQAAQSSVSPLINVGTSLLESRNCIALAQRYETVFASVGLHPNDCTADWKDDFQEITKLVLNKEKNRIVAIGECGLDRHYPDYNIIRQKDAFKAHIELALEHDLALIVHTQMPATKRCGLEEFAGQIRRGIIHCFSEDQSFANQAIAWNFVLGIGGTITYPKNQSLREIVKNLSLEKIVLETDAPFLPPQPIRGQQNHPEQIKNIAQAIATLKEMPLDLVEQQTYATTKALFKI